MSVIMSAKSTVVTIYSLRSIPTLSTSDNIWVSTS